MERPDISDQLIDLIANDERVRQRLASDGSLFDGYHPAMEAVHRANAVRLREIIGEVGWPGQTLVGDTGAEAAWRIAQHAIGEPDFMRGALLLVQAAVLKADVPAEQAAYLEDRIRSLEGRLQLYGTQYDWDDRGEMSPFPDIENPAGLDSRRAAVGLGRLDQNTARMRAGAAASGELPPTDLAQRRREMEEWARRVGWRGESGE